MARILIIAYYFPPENSSGGQRPMKMAKYLEQCGQEAVVLTSSYAKKAGSGKNIIRVYDPSHNGNRVGLRKLQWLCLRLGIELDNRLGIPASVFSPWKRAVLLRADEIMARARPGWILATYPPVETLEIGMLLSRKYDLPLIADFRDGLLFEAIESRRLRRFACVRKAYAAIEAGVAAAASALLTVSDPLSDYFRETYHHPRVETVPNGFDPGESAQPPPAAELEAGCFHVVHTGRFALSDAGCAITPLVEALQELLSARPELAATLRLHLLGELSRRERRLLAGLAQRGVVRLHGAVDRPRALAFQRRADLLLLVTDPVRRSVATTKIFEYLQARRPILALTGRSFAAEIIERTRSGWVVSSQDRPQIARTLERIILDPAFYQAVDMDPNAIEAYSFVHGCRRLAGLLSSPIPR
jgi:glycosyltransferase involved in cell wall biosynthesis